MIEVVSSGSDPQSGVHGSLPGVCETFPDTFIKIIMIQKAS